MTLVDTTMQGTSPIEKIKTFFDTDRGVSPVIAVALLILIAIGFAVAIQGVGTDIVDSVQEPPEANIDGNPQAPESGSDTGSIVLTVDSVQNADELEIQIDGEDQEVEDWRDPRSGLTEEVDVEYGQDIQVQVVAINLPDDERVVYTYEVPDSN